MSTEPDRPASASSESSASSRRPGRGRRILRRTLLALLGLIVVAVVGFVVYANITFTATPEPLQAVQGDPAIEYREEGGAIILSPVAGPPVEAGLTGLIVIPGAKVDPEAYVATFAPLVEEGRTVIIPHVLLNFAIFDTASFETYAALAPEVESWAIAGHSLGGVRACLLAESGGPVGLVLLGSYCSADLSASGLPVLSVAGAEDGLSTPAKIDAAAHLLPADTVFVELPGVAHAQFGSYGEQPGDGTPAVSEEEAHRMIVAEVAPFLRQLDRP